jgi:hypothetical protein
MNLVPSGQSEDPRIFWGGHWRLPQGTILLLLCREAADRICAYTRRHKSATVSHCSTAILAVIHHGRDARATALFVADL